MEDAKSFLASRTVWGVLVSLIAFGAQKAGYNLGDAEQAAIVDTALQVVQVGGALFALYGRVAATKVIGSTKAAA